MSGGVDKRDPEKTGVTYAYTRMNENGEEETIENKGIVLPKNPCERVEKHRQAEKKRRRNKKEKISEVKKM